MTETDEILQRIQERLDARGGASSRGAQGANPGPGGSGENIKSSAGGNPGPDNPPRSALRRDLRNDTIGLSPDQITSQVFVIAPTQISYIAEIFANSVADAMNMRAFAQKIKILAEQSLRAALTVARKQGAGTN
ncbi:MAG: hypothetical protein FWC61_00770 [Proteobacteria bacterium]|nr:hypothetical protein [Pseudomonadota bacterium]